MKVIDNGHFITKCKLFSLLRNIWHRAVESDLNLIKWICFVESRDKYSFAIPFQWLSLLNFKISNTSMIVAMQNLLEECHLENCALLVTDDN